MHRETLERSVLTGMLSSDQFLPLRAQKAMWKSRKDGTSQRRWMTSKKPSLPDAVGLTHTGTHRDYGSMQRACMASSQMRFQNCEVDVDVIFHP